MTTAIIGAGFTGLAAAFDLVKAGKEVLVIEAAPVAGGLAAGFKLPEWDWYLEKYYHHWFASDQAMKRLLTETSLRDKMLYFQPQTAVYFNQHFYPLDSPLSVLKFPGLSLSQKITFGWSTAYLKYLSSWENLEPFLAVNWLRQHYGDHSYRLLWQPLLQGKFGPYYQTVTMAWMWARLKARTPSLGTYRGGFQACLNDLVAYLKHLGVKFCFNLPLKTVGVGKTGFTLTTPSRTFTVDQVLLTLPPKAVQHLVPALPGAYLAPIIRQPYLSAVVVIYALNHPLSPHGIYWHNLPKSQGFPFLSLVEHTNFVSPQYFGNDRLVYCGDYVPSDHEYMSMDHKDLVKKFTLGLKMVNPKISADWVKQTWVFKADYAQPVPGVNHSRLIPSIHSPLKGLYLASMAQVYPWDRGTNYAVDLGRRAANLMLSS